MGQSESKKIVAPKGHAVYKRKKAAASEPKKCSDQIDEEMHSTKEMDKPNSSENLSTKCYFCFVWKSIT